MIGINHVWQAYQYAKSQGKSITEEKFQDDFMPVLTNPNLSSPYKEKSDLVNEVQGDTSSWSTDALESAVKYLNQQEMPVSVKHCGPNQFNMWGNKFDSTGKAYSWINHDEQLGQNSDKQQVVRQPTYIPGYISTCTILS